MRMRIFSGFSRSCGVSTWCLMRRQKCEISGESARPDMLGVFRNISNGVSTGLTCDSLTTRNCGQLPGVQQMTDSVKHSSKHQGNDVTSDSSARHTLSSTMLHVCLPHVANTSSSYVNKSGHFNIGQYVNKYVNMNIFLYKCSSLQTTGMYFSQTGSVSLRSLHTFSNKYNRGIWINHHHTGLTGDPLQGVEKSTDVNTWPFSSCGILFPYMLFVKLCIGHPSMKQQRNYSIKRKNYTFPELKPEDLEEWFVRGSGPGGQAVNKTSNCAVLKHKPSGIVIKCHESRSLEDNRKLARQKLEEKLDHMLNGDESFISQQAAENAQYKQEKTRRAKKNLELKKAFKEREGLE